MIANGVLPEFQEFLLTNKLAQEKYISYLAYWVSQFLAFSNNKGQPDIALLVAEFLNSLEGRDNIKDWQIRQAAEALRLYLNHFKGAEGLTAAQGTPTRKSNLSDSRELLAEMKRLIRLKHFAYNTEVAYLDWTERFFAYLRETAKGMPSPNLTPDAVQNFLSHLAINKRVSSSTQNQALNALIFFYRFVLEIEPGPDEIRAVRAHRRSVFTPLLV